MVRITTHESPTLAVIERKESVKEICRNFHRMLEWCNAVKYANILEYIMFFFYACFRGKHVKRLKQWSACTGVPAHQLLALNMSYELAQAGAAFPFGCTSIMMRNTEGHIVHVRCVDWALDGMGKHTVAIDNSRYVSITTPGALGSISGMVRGKFSITLNWASPSRMPRVGASPLTLIQRILEGAESYEEAVRMAEETKLTSSCFFSIAGAVDACVVERTQRRYSTRRLSTEPLIVTNHYNTKFMQKHNKHIEKGEYAFSLSRFELATAAAKDFEGDDYMSLLNGEDILNGNTVHQMVFHPREGQYEAAAFNH